MSTGGKPEFSTVRHLQGRPLVNTLVPSYGSAVPEGVPIKVMTSQSMVLSGEGAKVSEITPRKSDKPFFIFSVAPEEPSVCREKPAEEASGLGAGCDLGYGV